MLYKTLSAAVYGIDANIIEVEVDVSMIKTSEDHFHTVGLPDAAVRESRDRVRSALKNCGYDIPPTNITVNLAPADIRKEGSGFDLPMALAIVEAYGGLNKKDVPHCLFVGELALDGSVRGVRGALPIAIEARGRKISRLVVPELNAREAAMVGGVAVYPVKSLIDVIQFVNSGNGISPLKVDSDHLLSESQSYLVDFKDVRGQQTAKRALEVACAGGHNILRAQPSDDRAAGLRQDHAGEAYADHPAPLHVRGSARNHQDPQRGGSSRRPHRASRRAPVPRSASHDFGRRAYWRRRCAAPRRSFFGAQWRFVSR